MNNKKWIEEKGRRKKLWSHLIVIPEREKRVDMGEKDSSRPKMHILINQLVFIRMYKLV